MEKEQNNKIENKFDKDSFINKIYTTRKARINAYKRLKANTFIISTINIFYSIIVLGLSIYLIKYPSDSLTMFNTIFSAVLLLSITYMSSMKYGSRANEMKNNYTKLNNILNRAQNIDFSNKQKAQSIIDEHNAIMLESENHISIDYYKHAIHENKRNKEKLSFKKITQEQFDEWYLTLNKYEKATYCLYVLGRRAFITSLFIVPIITILILLF